MRLTSFKNSLIIYMRVKMGTGIAHSVVVCPIILPRPPQHARSLTTPQQQASLAQIHFVCTHFTALYTTTNIRPESCVLSCS
jgi:hypothetical protein